jgi:GMP synthase-like glutamine amidotransferase
LVVNKSNKSLNVYVVGPTFGLDGVFPEYGFTPWTEANIADCPKVDILCLTGGADISPELYGQNRIKGTYTNDDRDKREVEIYHRYKDLPKLGICRGAQLLNVLNGGSMYQHVDRHSGSHMVETKSGRKVLLCSVHHQLMIPNPKVAEVIAWNTNSTRRWNDNGDFERKPDEIDPEVIWIEQDKALCFQAHPEFGPQSCTDYFFELVEEYILS